MEEYKPILNSLIEGSWNNKSLSIVKDGEDHYIFTTNLGSVRVKKSKLESDDFKNELKAIGLLIGCNSYKENVYPETYVKYDTDDISIKKMNNYYFGFGGLNKCIV